MVLPQTNIFLVQKCVLLGGKLRFNRGYLLGREFSAPIKNLTLHVPEGLVRSSI